MRLTIILAVLLVGVVFARPIGETTIASPLDSNGYVEVSIENSDAEVTVANDSTYTVTIADSSVVSISGANFSGSALRVALESVYGDLFVGYYEFSAVADSDSVEVVIDAAVGSQWGFAVQADKATIVELMESFAYSDSGTALTLYNVDRTSATTASSDISHTPTDTAAGTSIWGTYVTANTYYTSELFGTWTPFTLDTLAADSIDYCLDIENNGSGDMAGYVVVYCLE